MRRATRMDVNCGARIASPARTGEAPGCAGVIEMNVAQKNVANIPLLKATFPKIGNHVVESRFRSGIEQRDPIVRLERRRRNDTGVTQLTRIENVDFQSRK